MINLFRHLIYEEKPLSAFSIAEEGTMDFAIFEVLMAMGQFKDEKSIQRLFNDAYFVCTILVDYYQLPYMHINDCKAMIKNAYQSELFISDANIALADRYSYVVLIVSYCLLKHIDNWGNDINLKRTIARLEEKIQGNPNIKKILFAKITSATSNNKSIYSANVFHRRKITKDILTGISWYIQTQRYNNEIIREIVGYAATSEEKTLLIESILRNVKRYSRSNPANIDIEKIFESLKKIREEVEDNIQNNKEQSPLVKLYKQGDMGAISVSSSNNHSDTEEEMRKAKEIIAEQKKTIGILEDKIKTFEARIDDLNKTFANADEEVSKDWRKLKTSEVLHLSNISGILNNDSTIQEKAVVLHLLTGCSVNTLRQNFDNYKLSDAAKEKVEKKYKEALDTEKAKSKGKM